MRQRHSTTRRRYQRIPGQKQRGCLQERVKKVGAERFAIVAVDCGKMEARARVADFYGDILLEPFTIHMSRLGLSLACGMIQETLQKHKINDWVCAIETTGRYHLSVKQTFKEQQWDVRDVHPYTSSLIRRSADLGLKTDDIDLAAIHRAAVDGLAMTSEVLDVQAQQWRLLVRHRRDLVEKCVTLKNQLKESFHAYLPGYTQLWTDDHFWKSFVPATIATTFASPAAIQEVDDELLRQVVRDAGSVLQKRTIDRLRAWTHQAAPPDEAASIHYRRAVSLWSDLRSKWQEIRVFELDLADYLCQTPCVLLLAFPGINVISSSDYGAELGPISNYANSKCIAGRAGLYPSRYQTSQTDCPNGRLVVRRNAPLRAALMRLARCLNAHNQYFMSVAAAYRERHPTNDAKVVIARSFSRLSYYILAGRMLPAHAAIQNQEKILQKLMAYYNERNADPPRTTSAITAAMRQLPASTLRGEYSDLAAEYEAVQKKKRKPGVKRLAEILPAILLRIEERCQEESENEAQSGLTSTTIEDRTHDS